MRMAEMNSMRVTRTITSARRTATSLFSKVRFEEWSTKYTGALPSFICLTCVRNALSLKNRLTETIFSAAENLQAYYAP